MRAEEGLHLNDDGCTEKHPPLTAKQFNLRWQHYCREPLAFLFPTIIRSPFYLLGNDQTSAISGVRSL